jgi:LmbE family N-acetylglucosaminyl deacetylase
MKNTYKLPLLFLLLSIIVFIALFMSDLIWVEFRRCNSYLVSEKLHPSNNRAFAVDFVITWVDSSDKQWQSEIEHWRKIEVGDIKPKRYPDPDPENSNNELHLACDSVLRYMPWVRNIIVVTQRPQRPNFLEMHPDYKKIRVVHHDEIFTNKDDLPVFNSHSIESNIHNIPDLSEQYIYSNDDCYIVRHMLLSDFFDVEGHPITNGKWLPNWGLYGSVAEGFDKSGYLAAWSNVCKIVLTPTIFKPTHTCQPMTRDLMKLTQKGYRGLFESTSKTKFRHQRTEQIPAIGLALNEGIVKKLAVIHDDSSLQVHMDDGVSDKYHTVCLNSKFDGVLLDKIRSAFLSPNPKRQVDVGGPILMLVAHCDDDLLFGAPYLLLSSNEVNIVVLTHSGSNNRLRIRELESAVAKINFDGGQVRLLDTNFPLLNDSKSYSASETTIQSISGHLKQVVSNLSISCVVSHDMHGEYGHKNHKSVHKIATQVARSINTPLKSFVEVWKDTIPILTSEENNKYSRQRARLLRCYESQNTDRYINWMDNQLKKQTKNSEV